MQKSQVKTPKLPQKQAPKGPVASGNLPPGIKTVPILSPTPGDMCRNSGGWGEPCRYFRYTFFRTQQSGVVL